MDDPEITARLQNELINQFGGFTIKQHTKRITNIVSALTARTQFGQIMKRASRKNERFVVDRRGQLLRL